MKDAEWIAQLLRHGLLKASFIPNRNQRELRELVRYRRSIIEERARQHNRIQKVLEGANIKLGSVVSDIMGVSSKDMLHAIANGEEDPEKLASFARRTMKKKKDELELAPKRVISDQEDIERLDSIPGHNESADKRKSSKGKKGNKYLKSALTEAAHSVGASKNYLGAMYRRTLARKGRKRVAIVVAHAMLRIAYYLLTRRLIFLSKMELSLFS
uniref:IS110 family transposase n=1 Tax=Paenibacillus sedimenti TaxID=2770274 RepID=UPI0028991BF3|nr:transposase [Paenibacillus sedimenti]